MSAETPLGESGPLAASISQITPSCLLARQYLFLDFVPLRTIDLRYHFLEILGTARGVRLSMRYTNLVYSPDIPSQEGYPLLCVLLGVRAV